MIRPVSSATGMNTDGGTLPRTGWVQRSSASQVVTRPVLQVDQRLIIQFELLRGQCVAQVELERAALLHRLLHLHGEEAMAAAAAVLGGVQRHVGLLQEFVGVDAVVRRHGDADRGADVDAVAVDLERLLQRAGQALRQPLGVLPALGRGLQHDELVAAEAGDHVARTDDGGEPAARLP